VNSNYDEVKIYNEDEVTVTLGVIEITTPIITTTTVEITTVPTRYCVVQRPHTVEQYIAEGKSRRVRYFSNLLLNRNYFIKIFQ
jgi:hypothetical protein